MIDNPQRTGRFTSSQIHRLTTFGRDKKSPGAPFGTYVDEKRREGRLGRSLSLNKGNRSTAWGELMEWYVMNCYIGYNYQHHGKTTTIHPRVDYWAGSPDLVQTGVKVGDIKCFEPDNFTKLADVLLLQDVAAFKDAYTAEYWQLVSNACIHDVPRAEMILFMPYYSELEDVREWMDGPDAPEEAETWKYKFIFDAPDHELPFVPDGCEIYTSLITFEFEVPIEDKAFLEMRVKMAGELLIEPLMCKCETPTIRGVDPEYCDVCGSTDVIEAPHMGRNCNRCHPL